MRINSFLPRRIRQTASLLQYPCPQALSWAPQVCLKLHQVAAKNKQMQREIEAPARRVSPSWMTMRKCSTIEVFLSCNNLARVSAAKHSALFCFKSAKATESSRSTGAALSAKNKRDNAIRTNFNSTTNFINVSPNGLWFGSQKHLVEAAWELYLAPLLIFRVLIELCWGAAAAPQQTSSAFEAFLWPYVLFVLPTMP